MSSDFQVTGRRPLLESYVFAVERRTVSDGTTSFERDIVTHAGAVAIIAVRDDGAVGLLRQYRASFNDVNWELPAGTRDVGGEPPEQTARRELEEEMGCVAGDIRELFRYMNSRGWTDQTTIVYLARDLEFVERRTTGPEENSSEVHWLQRDELERLLVPGHLLESSTLMGLLWFLREPVT